MNETLFLTTTPGLEPCLMAELSALGLSGKLHPDGVEVEGKAGLHRRLNLHLRCASRVRLRLGKFSAPNPQVFQEQLGRFQPQAYGSALHVRVVAHAISYSKSAQRLAEVAFRLSGVEKDDSIEVLVHVDEGEATVSVDTSGTLLYQRGYRQELGQAPMRETLAAGLLHLLGYEPELPLWDVMCGSGTWLIEAAWRAMRQPPGILRHFAFERFPKFDSAGFEAEKAEARRLVRAPPSLLLGSDINAGALGVSRRNAKRAGVFEHLKLERWDATVVKPREGMAPGLLVANMPYGKRVGDQPALQTLYSKFGQNIKSHFSGWRFGLLVKDDEAEGWLGLPIERADGIDNGGLGCRLLSGRL